MNSYITDVIRVDNKLDTPSWGLFEYLKREYLLYEVISEGEDIRSQFNEIVKHALETKKHVHTVIVEYYCKGISCGISKDRLEKAIKFFLYGEGLEKVDKRSIEKAETKALHILRNHLEDCLSISID